MLSQKRRDRKQRGATMVMGAASMIAIIPLVGLGIDSGLLYIVKARLQSSVDGASLAAARALTLGQTTAAQAANARTNATNWFWANFPNGTMGTNTTVLQTPVVADDSVNPLVRNVTVSASTRVPTYFMQLLGATSTTVGAIGNAARRDVVVMMVLDQSTSMNSNNGCANMRTAAKLFTGQFAAGRDRIGMLTYSDFVDTDFIVAPTTNFPTVLGYSNSQGSANGVLDTITCTGNTGIAQGISIGYKAILASNLPGALNIILFMTDGLANAITVNMETPYPGTPTTTTFKSTSRCRDSAGTRISSGGNMLTNTRAWTPGITMSTYFTGSTFTVPTGVTGVVGTGDGTTGNPWGIRKYFSGTRGTISTTSAPGCYFNNADGNTDGNGDPLYGETDYILDIAYLPATDVYGNALDSGYLSPIRRTGSNKIRADDHETMQNAAGNASDQSGVTARTGAIPTYVFAVGLGGTSGTPPDFGLLQRLANDPNADMFNEPALYGTYTPRANQFQGTFIYSSSPSELGQAFLKISSMILRLSQ